MDEGSKSRGQYLKYSTPSKYSALSSPFILKVAPVHFPRISTSRLFHLICISRSHCTVLQFLMSHPDGMCIPHKLHRDRVSFPSWTTTIQDQKCRNMKCSRSLPTLCATAGQPGTGHLNNWINLGKDTTYVVGPSPISLTPLFWGKQMLCWLVMCCLR